MVELLDFNEYERYQLDLSRYERREEIHREAMTRKAKKEKWDKYKRYKLGKKSIG